VKVETKDQLRERLRALEERLAKGTVPEDSHRQTAADALRKCEEMIVAVETLMRLFPKSFE